MDNNQQELKPRLGIITTISIVIGAMIGSGIFRKPALMAGNLGTPELLIAVWVIAGIVTLFGALTNAEIASMFNKTGGQYVYFKEMYGEFVAFLYGWAVFAIIQTGSIASIAYVFSEYSQYFYQLPRFSEEIEKGVYLAIPFIGKIFPLQNIGVKLLTISLIFFLTIVNYFGVVLGGIVQNIFTSLKILAILALIVFGFIYAGGSVSHFSETLPIIHSDSYSPFLAIIVALSGAFWAYDGWNNVTYISGEVKNSQKNIPIALFIGTAVVIGIYILVNLAYIYVLPLDQIASSKLVASDMAKTAIGGIGGAFVAAAVMASAFGSTNGSIMASARVHFAMAREKMFFAKIGNAHEKFGTPHISLFVQAIWAAVLVISGAFDILTDMLIFVAWIFYFLGAIGVFVLRKKYPERERPYKVPFYPIIPLVFIIFSLIFVVFTLYNDVRLFAEGKSELINSLFGLLLLASGLPFYYYFVKKKRR